MDNIPDNSIDLDDMNDPVLCKDKFTNERTSIIFIRNSLSPMTRQLIDETKLIHIKNDECDDTLGINISFENYLRKKHRHLKIREGQLYQGKNEYIKQNMGTSF